MCRSQMPARRSKNAFTLGEECQPGTARVIQANCQREKLVADIRQSSMNIVPSSDGDVSTVSEAGDKSDYSRQTSYFDFHKDGLYYPEPPHFLMLLCEDPGRGDTPTVVVDTRPVVAEIARRPELGILREVEMVYRGKTGDEQAHPLIGKHPSAGWPILNLGSRAFLRPSTKIPTPSTTLRQMVAAMTEVYRLLDNAVVLRHRWKAGEVLLLDNHTFVHGREANAVDHNRKLARIWLTSKHAANT